MYLPNHSTMSKAQHKINFWVIYSKFNFKLSFTLIAFAKLKKPVFPTIYPLLRS